MIGRMQRSSTCHLSQTGSPPICSHLFNQTLRLTGGFSPVSAASQTTTSELLLKRHRVKVNSIYVVLTYHPSEDGAPHVSKTTFKLLFVKSSYTNSVIPAPGCESRAPLCKLASAFSV